MRITSNLNKPKEVGWEKWLAVKENKSTRKIKKRLKKRANSIIGSKVLAVQIWMWIADYLVIEVEKINLISLI